MISMISQEIEKWLIDRTTKLRNGQDTIVNIELDYYDYFFDVHSDILETIWIKIMEGDRNDQQTV